MTGPTGGVGVGVGVGVGAGSGVGVGVGVGAGSGVGVGVGVGAGVTGEFGRTTGETGTISVSCGRFGSSPVRRQTSVVSASTLHT